MPDLTCVRCHKTFHVKPSECRARTPQYCSLECRHAALCLTTPCLNCGTPVSRFVSQRKKRVFCSKRCITLYERQTVTCQWHGCPNTFDARVSTHHGHTVYKVKFTKKGIYSRFHYCAHHRALLKRYGMRANALHRIWEHSDRNWGARYIQGRGTRLVLFDRAGGRCERCGVGLDFLATKTWIVDHVVPLFKGGITSFNNLQVLCKACDEVKTRPEKSEASLLRHAGRSGVDRWITHYEKDDLITDLRRQLAEAHREIAKLKGVRRQRDTREGSPQKTTLLF